MQWNSKQWQWLKQEGYVNGNSKLLAEGKKRWKQHYHREYQRRRRQAKRERVITFSQAEDKEIMSKAEAHHQAVGVYIRDACLAYGRNQFVVPDKQLVIEIKEEMALTRYAIEAIEQKVTGLLKQTNGAAAQCEILAQHYSLLVNQIDYLSVFVVGKLEKPPCRPKP